MHSPPRGSAASPAQACRRLLRTRVPAFCTESHECPQSWEPQGMSMTTVWTPNTAQSPCAPGLQNWLDSPLGSLSAISPPLAESESCVRGRSGTACYMPRIENSCWLFRSPGQFCKPKVPVSWNSLLMGPHTPVIATQPFLTTGLGCCKHPR